MFQRLDTGCLVVLSDGSAVEKLVVMGVGLMCWRLLNTNGAKHGEEEVVWG